MAIDHSIIRVMDDYYSMVVRRDRYGILRKEIKPRKKPEIIQDYGKDVLLTIPKYDGFCLSPDNINFKQVHTEGKYRFFNTYKPFAYTPKEGEWKWTKVLLEHIFGEQYHIGLIYLQVLYKYPEQALPVLALVSQTRQTGKSTFIDWLTAMYGDNMVILNPGDFNNSHNHIYAYANIIAVEETAIDKNSTVEKVKALSTQKMMTVNPKFVQQYTLPFFGKIIMASNNEDKFMKVDEDEIRFFVRKVGLPTKANHNILNDMIKEIPAFIHYLNSLPEPDFSRSRMVFTAEELSNESLDKVKHESKEWMHKELEELLTDFLENNSSAEPNLLVSPTDIKNKFFNHNNQIQISYLRKVLQTSFKFPKSEHTIRYQPFFIDPSTTGRPFIIDKYLFIDKKPNQQDEELPF